MKILKCPFVIKVCTKCKRILVANEINFKKRKGGKYGLSSECKVCSNKRYKEWRENNLEYDKERHLEWNNKNKKHIKNYDKKRYQENREKILKRRKEYDEKNPEKVFNRHNRRRSRENNQGNGITKEQWREMMEFFDWRCAYSGISLDKNNRSVDHIMSLNKNGENEIWNCVPMLISYNCSKHNKNMEDWYIEQEFFDIDRLLKIYEWIEYAYNKWNIIK